MNKMQIEDAKYEVDLTQTFFANIFWLAWILVTLVIVVTWFNVIDGITDEVNRLLAVVISAFVVIKLLSWCGKPHLHFRERQVVDEEGALP